MSVVLAAEDPDTICAGRLEQVLPDDPMTVFGFPPPPDRATGERALFAFDEALAAQRHGEHKRALELYTLHIEGGAYWGAKYGNTPQMLSLAYGNRAAAHAALGNFEMALEDNRAARALWHDPELHARHEAQIFNQRALVALKNRDFEKALQDFACATSLSPRDAQLWANRCFLAAHLRPAAEARSYCEKALAIDPENADAKKILGQLSEN